MDVNLGLEEVGAMVFGARALFSLQNWRAARDFLDLEEASVEGEEGRPCEGAQSILGIWGRRAVLTGEKGVGSFLAKEKGVGSGAI